jgi:hypothetical protein
VEVALPEVYCWVIVAKLVRSLFDLTKTESQEKTQLHLLEKSTLCLFN